MRIWTISDLHGDHNISTTGITRLPRDVDADVLIVAGDIGGRLGGQGRLWLEEQTRDLGIPVLVVPGNHCYYGSDLTDEVDRFRRKTTADWITVLDGKGIVIGDTRIWGGTLWTDFDVTGNREVAMKIAHAQMTDYKRISFGKSKVGMGPMRTREIHVRQVAALDKFLSRPWSGPTVVVTHHPPSPQSLKHGDVTEILDAAYASDLEGLICEKGPDLWIHGHVHKSRDYTIGKTRIVANPRGYDERLGFGKAAVMKVENSTFDPRLVVAVQPRLDSGYGQSASEYNDKGLADAGGVPCGALEMSPQVIRRL